jgi:ureidoacrylate peracid hydrolase
MLYAGQAIVAERPMHKLNIPPWVTERIVAKYGREHVYEELVPARTALVVVDMQNAFMLPGVAYALCPAAVEIVPNVNRLATAVRETGGTVVWAILTFDEQSIREWSTLYEMSGPERSAKRRIALTEGSKGHALWHELDVRPEDLTVSKRRYSAFLPGACDLPDILRARGLDTVLIGGTVTNVCCESSARDAMQLNFKTVMITDANAAMTDEEHAWSLISFYNSLGDIMSTDMAIACLRKNAAKGLAAAE